MMKTPLLPGLVVMGIDTGFANVGAAVLRCSGTDSYQLLEVCSFSSKAIPKKQRTKGFRVLDDDHRRFREQFEELDGLVRTWGVRVLAVEGYRPNTKQGGGGHGAWKTCVSYGVALTVGFSHRIPTYPYWPQDLKRGIAGKAGVSKEGVAQALAKIVPNASALVKTVKATTKHEHVWDAMGHAVLAYREIVRLRTMVAV